MSVQGTLVKNKRLFFKCNHLTNTNWNANQTTVFQLVFCSVNTVDISFVTTELTLTGMLIKLLHSS